MKENRLFVASRTGTEIDLPKYFGMYKFSVVPLSLFTLEGSLYYPKYKTTIATELKNLQTAEQNQSIEE